MAKRHSDPILDPDRGWHMSPEAFDRFLKEQSKLNKEFDPDNPDHLRTMGPPAEYRYRFPRPAVTVDIVLFASIKDEYNVLLIKRRDDPYKGKWALPGGYVNENEDLEDAAWRELGEETGLKGKSGLIQVGAFGEPGRDPRGHVIAVAFAAIVKARKPKAADDAADAKWHRLSKIPGLAFDHAEILAKAAKRIGIPWTAEDTIVLRRGK